MDTLIHADIFFFITTIAVIAIGGVIVIAGFYIVSILSDFKDLSRRVKREGELTSEDLSELRSKAKTEGVRLSHFIDFFSKRSKTRGKK